LSTPVRIIAHDKAIRGDLTHDWNSDIAVTLDTGSTAYRLDSGAAAGHRPPRGCG